MRTVLPDEMSAALKLLLGADGELAADAQVADFMRFTAARGISLAGIWVVADGDRLAWAGLPMVSPGRTMLVVGPGTDMVDPDAMAAGIDGVCRHYAGRNVQLAQAMLDPSETGSIGVFRRIGFQHVAELDYLTLELNRPAMPRPLPGKFELTNYSPETHRLFAEAITDSYQDSHDCPALNGIRSIDDVIDGHKSAGEYDPADWFVMTHAGSPVAVLVLSRIVPADAMELVYLGVSPDGRRHGLANYLMQIAAARSAQRGMARITLAVDSTNTPALNLYFRHGYQRTIRRVAMIRRLDV